eukprot:1138530-Pelagomonas_calceolata.AAC.2
MDDPDCKDFVTLYALLGSGDAVYALQGLLRLHSSTQDALHVHSPCATSLLMPYKIIMHGNNKQAH